jgi:hypothetical protein
MLNLIAIVALLAGVQDTALSIIPRPVQLTRRTGAFVVTSGTVIATDRATRQIGYQLADWLQPATGYRLSVASSPGAATRTISLRLDSTLSRMGEGYRLTISRRASRFRLPRLWRQTLRSSAARFPPAPAGSLVGAGGRDRDQPRFPWRGAHRRACAVVHAERVRVTGHRLLALHKLAATGISPTPGWRPDQEVSAAHDGRRRRRQTIGHSRV